MDFAALQVFKAVVDEGGISPAAKKLHRVQSNVTTRIQQLEASLGAQLFVRDKRRLFLSPAGELFLKYAEQLLDLSQQARAAVQGDAPRGVFRIGTLESTAASRLPPVLSRYHEKYPAVRVELTTGTADALVDAVLSRKVEAAFVADCTVADQLELMPVFSEELVVIAPRSHPRIRRPQDVRSDTIISFPSGCAYRRHLQAWLAAGGVVPDKVLDLSSYHAIVACVASGTGIALAPRSVLETIRRTEAVTVHPLADKRPVTTSLVWRKGESSLPLKALQAELTALNPGGKKASGPALRSRITRSRK
jgi:DNA-binding transcriptional LysR family regulator